jgi:hypothetical protein
MLMGGFFIDVVIRTIAKSFRREARATSAERWPVIDARISKFSAPKAGERGRPYLVYTYEVNGETHYGSASGFDIGDSLTRAKRGAMEATTTLRVRYDPADPMSSRILNLDNPTLPFEIDHDPF